MVITTRRTKDHTARITSQGQITIPKAVRDALGVAPGDDVEFEPGDDGFLMRHRTRTSVLDFSGIAGKTTSRIPQTAEELDRVIAEGMSAAASPACAQRKRRAGP